MRKKITSAVIMLLLVLVGSQAHAGLANVFLYHSRISAANLGDKDSVQISLYSSPTNQSGSGTPLSVGTHYTIDRNSSYAGTTPAVKIAINNCPAGTAYVLLKDAGSTRYAILSASTPDIPGDDQTPGITSYRAGPPTPPAIGAINVGYESAKVLSLTYDPDYLYSSVMIQVTPASPDITTPSGLPSSYAMGEYVDGRVLLSGQTYAFRIKGTAAGVDPALSAWGERSFTMLSGGGAQSFVLTLESKVAAGGSGLNSFSLPFLPDAAGRWWTFKTDGTPLYVPGTSPPTNEVKGFASLVTHINAAAGGGYISSFGRWRRDLQQLEGVMIGYFGTGANQLGSGSAIALNALGNLKAGDGYQVYIGKRSDGANPPAKIELVIKNTP